MSSVAAIRAAIPAEISGLIVSAKFEAGVATLVADAGALGRAAAAQLQAEIEAAVAPLEGVAEVRVALMAHKRVRRIIAVGSGKGGVGKSTLTANLAVALARAGRKVGVVDADIYGPSQPLLLGQADAKPRAEGKQLIAVDSAFGVKLLSMGQMIAPGKAIAWRGPMVGQALGQLIDADWGDTELLLVDLPPGTGDVQLTMLSKFKPAGAVIVSTPQDLALIDARRAIDLFAQGQVPVIGMVENMAGYQCPHCGEASDPFGHGGTQAAAAELGIPFLGRVPLQMAIRVDSDAGQPAAAGDAAHGAAFREIAGKLSNWLDAPAAGALA